VKPVSFVLFRFVQRDFVFVFYTRRASSRSDLLASRARVLGDTNRHLARAPISVARASSPTAVPSIRPSRPLALVVRSRSIDRSIDRVDRDRAVVRLDRPVSSFADRSRIRVVHSRMDDD